jgi:hypothetical protein
MYDITFTTGDANDRNANLLSSIKDYRYAFSLKGIVSDAAKITSIVRIH